MCKCLLTHARLWILKEEWCDLRNHTTVAFSIENSSDKLCNVDSAPTQVPECLVIIRMKFVAFFCQFLREHRLFVHSQTY
jgi:hypothetical protein